MSRDGAEVTSAGRSFYMRAPATGKARRPIVGSLLSKTESYKTILESYRLTTRPVKLSFKKHLQIPSRNDIIVSKNYTMFYRKKKLRNKKVMASMQFIYISVFLHILQLSRIRMPETDKFGWRACVNVMHAG